jgi:hypothetical protein
MPIQRSIPTPSVGAGEQPIRFHLGHANAHTSRSVNLAAAPYTFPFKFQTSGWHQFVINTTWGRPTIVRALLRSGLSLHG